MDATKLEGTPPKRIAGDSAVGQGVLGGARDRVTRLVRSKGRASAVKFDLQAHHS